MNQLLPYEIGIAKKMEQLPVPKMADVIWDNILAQLNTDLENLSENGNEVLQKVTVKTAKIIWWVAGCIIIIIVCVLLLKQKMHSAPSPKIRLPEKTEQSLQGGEPKNAPETSQVSNHDIQTVHRANGIIMDSITINPKAEPSLPISNDSVAISKTFPQNQDSIVNNQIITPGRKNIGVKGIGDSSYRIVGKRDSME